MMLTSYEYSTPISLRRKVPMNLRTSNQPKPVLSRMTLTPAEFIEKNPKIIPPQEVVGDALDELESLITIRALSPYEIIELSNSKIPKILRRLRLFLSDLCKEIVSSQFFEAFIILVIVLNVCMLTAEDPDSPSAMLRTFDLIFIYIYTSEAALKIGGLGFILHKQSYMRSWWNVLDFVIVVSAWFEYFFQEGVNLAVLRTLRLIRPLKSISSIKGLKLLMLALITSFRYLGQFLIVLVIFLLLFAIAGVQMWMGTLKYQCLDVNSGVLRPDLVCGNISCPRNLKCSSALDNPNFGMTNFDNILYAFLAVFQSITAEGWYDIMVSLQRSFSFFVFFYFVPLVFIGAFIVLNLILAVIKSSFKEVETKQKEKNNEFKDTITINCLVKEDYEEAKRSDATLSKLDSDEDELYEIDVKPKRNKTHILDDSFRDFSGSRKKLLKRKTIKSSVHINSFGELKKFFCKKLLKANGSYVRSLTTIGVINLNNHKFLIEISDSQACTSTSSEDVCPPVSIILGSSIAKQQFSYTIDDSDGHTGGKELLEKYSGTYVQVFNKLVSRMSELEAFSMLVSSASQEIMSSENENISGPATWHWSGLNVNSYCEFSPNERLTNFKYRLQPSGFKGKLVKWTHPLHLLVTNAKFNNAITICIVLNTIVLAYDHYGISSDMEFVLTTFNNVFTLIFTLEIALKLLGLGVSKYLQDAMNYLDGVVVIISIIEFFFLSQNSVVSAFRTIRLFRTFRVLRVARLFRYMSSMLTIIRAISRSLSRIAYLALLLLLLIIIFALLGMQIFGGKFEFHDSSPRANFDSFLWAFITVFQVLTTENWQEVAYNGMRSTAGPVSCLYFIIWIFIGNFVLLNLFLAILMDSFGTSTDTPESSSLSKKSFHKKKEEKLKSLDHLVTKFKDKFAEKYSKLENSKSFYLFAKNNSFRRMCFKIYISSKFDSLVLLMIALSSLKLIIDTYIIYEPSDSDVVMVSSYLDIFFTIAFILEFLVKSVSVGFFFSKGSYLRDGWNLLDFGIIVISVLELSVSGLNVSALKVLRLLRTLRPLRFITQNISIKIVVMALLESLAGLLNVVIVLLIVWLMFAILGVSLFGGKFYQCENPLLKTLAECKSYGFDWVNSKTNFDNVLSGMLTLFVISSLEGWPEIMLLAVDSTEPERGPEKNASELSVLFFIVFIFVGSFFFLNLFIGVIFDNFNEAKRNESSIASLFLTPGHVMWVEIQNLIIKSKPDKDIASRPSAKVRKLCYDISKSPYFDMFITICIVLNTLQMAIAYEEASSDYVAVLELINFFFTAIFIIEAILKLTGFGFQAYFHSVWNRFDFFVATASIVDIVVEFSLNSSISILRSGPQLIRVFKVLRVGKLVRLFKALKGLQKLITVLVYSFSAVLNVLSLLFLIFFIYAILGSFLFHDIEGTEIDEFTNFRNFGNAMLALLRIATGENWHVIMFEAVEIKGESSLIYFISFVTITSFIMLNLFVMVILQTFDDLKYNKHSTLKKFNKDLKVFKKTWQIFTRKNQGKRIHYSQLIDFMYCLGDELGVPTHLDKAQVLKKLSMMSIHIEGNDHIYFHDLLYAVLKVKYTRLLTNPQRNIYWKKILRMEEQKTRKKLEKLRTFGNTENRSEKNMNLFFMLTYMKMVFTAWRNYTVDRVVKSRSSATSREFELDFPGFNTIEHSDDSFL